MRLFNSSWRAATVGAIALVAVACTPAPPAALSAGHVVFDIHLHDGELEAHVGDHDAGTLYDSDQVVLVVSPQAASTVPAENGYSFLGAAGDPIYVLPQNHVHDGPELLHLGFAAEEIAEGTLVDDEVMVEMTGVTGPGSVHFYRTDDMMGDPLPAPVVLFDSDDPDADVAHIHVADHHTHGAWAFGAPGQYRVTLRFSAELTTGGAVESVPADYMFIVG